MRKYLHQSFHGRRHIGLYLAVLLIAFVGYFLGQVPMLMMLYRVMDNDSSIGTEELNQFMGNPNFEIFGIGSNTGFLLLLLTFVFAMLFFYFSFKYLHKRGFKTLITVGKKVRWGRIGFGFVFWFILTGIGEYYFFNLAPENYTFSFEMKKFIPLILLSLLILPIQTSFEEVIFRGYLMQGLGSILKYPFMPIMITSVAFAAIHGANPEVSQFGTGIMMTYYIGAGLLLGLITILDDGMELALGVHWATNFFGAVFMGYSGAAIQTESLYKTNNLDPTMMTIAFLLIGVVFVLVCTTMYRWKDWGYLFRDISGERLNLETHGEGSLKESLNIDYTTLLDDEK